MARKQKLTKSISEDDFVNNYWYATEIKAFAKSIGISPVSKLRKDELETLILEFLRTGAVNGPARTTRSSSPKDSDRGLSRGSLVVRYTNNPQTKEFLRAEAIKVDPGFRPKSGAMYRLNRWREEQIDEGRPLTYGDLVDEYVALCQTQGPFPQAPSGRYINFLSDFLKAESGATRQEAVEAWEQLKELPIPKDYRSWKKHSETSGGGRDPQDDVGRCC